jgi:hypothetical protein
LEKIRNDPVRKEKFHQIVDLWRRNSAAKRNTLGSLEVFNSELCNLRGVVVYAHGSGGLTVNNLRYMRMLAAEGYLVLAPDGMAGKRPKN